MPAGWEAIYAVVRRIPRGRVTTYGAVAALLGRPNGARQVGYALAALRGARHDVPWQRVLGARPRGRAAVSILDPMGAAVQEAKLRREGVVLDERGLIDLDRYGWKGFPAPPHRSRLEASAGPAHPRPAPDRQRRAPPRRRPRRPPTRAAGMAPLPNRRP
ncbi:MAG TPA: MGMT family protein [Anaeromyxobacter sp.]|nr:MGMT family protein [Anaeromyxobacter sp.]